MRTLTDRHEIAKALNFGKYPVLTIDMNNHGESDNANYSIGCDVRVEFNSANYGTLHTQGHIYIMDGKVKVSNNATCIKSSFGYRDVMNMAHWANTPVIKADQDVAIIYDFGEMCVVEIAHTSKRIDPNCEVVLTIERI